MTKSNSDEIIITNWGDALRHYKTIKSTIPWKPEQQIKVIPVTRYEKSREERIYDPILAKYRDSKKDNAVNEESQKKVNLLLNNTKQYIKQPYNIINNHSNTINDYQEKETKKINNKLDTKLDYNIINNMDLYDPITKERLPIQPIKKQGKSPVKSRPQQQQFSIITNKYLEKNEEKELQQKIKEKEIVKEKYWKTHDYNPIAAVYYDKRKEEQFQLERQQDSLKHEEKHLKHLPLSHIYGEGAAYNPITNNVLNQEKLEELNIRVASKGRKTIQQQAEEKVHKETEILDKNKEKKALLRIPYVKVTEGYRHGFDVITNERYVGCNKKEIFGVIRAKPQPTAWKKINYPEIEKKNPSCLILSANISNERKNSIKDQIKGSLPQLSTDAVTTDSKNLVLETSTSIIDNHHPTVRTGGFA